MKTSQTHIIRKQKLEIKYSGNENAFILQGKAEAFCMENLLPQIEKVLNEFPGEEQIEIGKIELDFNTASLQQLDETLAVEIAKQIRQKVAAHKTALRNENVVKKEDLFFEALIKYLKSGLVNVEAFEIIKASEQKLEKLALAGFTDYQKAELIKLFQSGEAARRFVQMVHFELWWKIIDALWAKEKNKTQVVKEKVLTISKQLKPSTFQMYFLRFQPEFLKNLSDFIEKGVDINLPETIALQILSDEECRKIHLQLPFEKYNERDKENLTERAGKELNTKPKGNAVNETNSLSHNIEKIVVSNAGLVLVAPFLPMFFKHVELVWNEGEKQVSRALLLLHYISTGKEHCKDYELVLPKLLMGLPVEGFYTMAHKISINEKEQVAELLNSVIQHWSILKTTSIDGLRNEFLQRTGYLIQKEEENNLKLDAGPIDMLLDHIPWNFRMIKLPWMKMLLNVYWGK